MAMTPAERKRAQRARDKLSEEQRLAALLAFTLSTPIFKGTAAKLDRIMAAAGIEERDDAITRLINNIDRRMTDDQIRELLLRP